MGCLIFSASETIEAIIKKIAQEFADVPFEKIKTRNTRRTKLLLPPTSDNNKKD